MKLKIFISALIIVLLMPVFSVVTVFAVVDGTSDSVQAEEPTVAPSDGEVVLTAEQRLQKLSDRNKARKAALSVRLTAVQKTRLTVQCKAAQDNKLQAIQLRADAAGANRISVHNNVVAKIEALITKIEAADVDTTDLRDYVVVLKTKVTDFETKFATYIQALKDSVDTDCTGDVEAFWAALEEARTLHSELRASASDIRVYITETIKPALQAIRQELATASDTTNAAGSE